MQSQGIGFIRLQVQKLGRLTTLCRRSAMSTVLILFYPKDRHNPTCLGFFLKKSFPFFCFSEIMCYLPIVSGGGVRLAIGLVRKGKTKGKFNVTHSTSSHSPRDATDYVYRVGLR